MDQSNNKALTEANVVYTYTREQAIQDGELVDISQTNEAKESGFRIPICVTRNLWGKINDCKAEGQDWKGRLWDVCFMASNAFRSKIKSESDCRIVAFKVKFYEDSNPIKLWLCFDECDGFTLMFPEDY